jgi:hypothetical protein
MLFSIFFFSKDHLFNLKSDKIKAITIEVIAFEYLKSKSNN